MFVLLIGTKKPALNLKRSTNHGKTGLDNNSESVCCARKPIHETKTRIVVAKIFIRKSLV